MGSADSEPGRGKDEGSQHRVKFDKGFYMARYEVTQELWQAVMNENPSVFRLSPLHPVESVSWNDCQEFLQKLNKICLDGSFRLPTEAEW